MPQIIQVRNPGRKKQRTYLNLTNGQLALGLTVLVTATLVTFLFGKGPDVFAFLLLGGFYAIWAGSHRYPDGAIWDRLSQMRSRVIYGGSLYGPTLTDPGLRHGDPFLPPPPPRRADRRAGGRSR